MRLSLLTSPVTRFCVLVLSCFVPVAAQTAPDKYASESIVIVRSENVYSFAADGTGWRERTIVARVQSEAAVRQLGVLSIPFAGSSERVEIAYARVRRADGSLVETPVADAMEMPEQVTREAPFYSDLKQKQLPIRNLRVGDTFEWKARVVKTKAEAPGEFWGQENMIEDAVALEQVIELRVPAGKAVKVWSPATKPVETTVAGEHVYRWTGSQLKPTAGKEVEAATEAKKKALWTPEQELNEEQGKLPGIAWTTFPSWEAVGAWYRGLEGDRMQPGPEVKAKVAEVTGRKTTEEEKVRAVYGFVATQVRYIGVAFGVGRYQPHRAAEVLENQYGDCKDKHTLLAAMLDVLGLKANAVLIGAGVRFNPDVPSPAAFNHLITQVPVGGQMVWLDATAEVAPYRMLVPVIRDHQALVIPETGAARVETTPKEVPFKQLQRMDAKGTLDRNGVSESHMTLTLRGDEELGIRQVLRQIPPAQYDQLVQRMSGSMGYGGTTSHAEISRAEDTAEPLTIRYDYHREKAGNDWEHYRTVAQLSPVTLPVVDEKEPVVRAIALGVPHTETSTSMLKLPEGWGAEVPEASHIHSPYATFDQTYRFDKGTLYAERKVEILVEKVPVTEWKKYKKFTDEVYENNDLYVQLTHTGAKPGEAAKAEASKTEKADAEEPKEERAGSDRSRAEKLVQSAFTEIEAGNLKSAGEKLDEAKALNPSQTGLWSGYGYAALKHGETTEAARLYEKELTLHPENESTYGPLVYLLTSTGKHAEAIAVDRRWVAAFPANLRALQSLIAALVQADDAKGAVTAAEAGMKSLPEDKQQDGSLQMQLGTAQMKAGMKMEGAATLVSLLKKTDNPGLLNDAAYELADEGEQMELAESSTRAALERLGAESRTWTLNERPQVLIAKSQLIVAAWDTMGWILFREKKAEEAESYLRAAWLNGQHAVVGEHLGDLLMARGDKAGAAKAYQDALGAVSPVVNAQGVREDKKGKDELEIENKLKLLPQVGRKSKAAQKKAGPVFLQASTSESRTLPLGPAGGRNGTAEYKLLLGPDGFDPILPAGDKEMTGAAAMIKKAKLDGFWPKGSDARLAKGGFLNCHSGVCDLVLMPMH